MVDGEIDEPLRAAMRAVLREHGWSRTTTERLAAAAGLSRVTLHRRGVRREALLEALANEAERACRDALWPSLVADAPAATRLEQALEALCDATEAHLDVLLALQDAARDALFHADRPGEVETRDAFVAPLARLLRDGALDGTLRSGRDPEEQAMVLFNALAATYLHLRSGHRWSPERARRGTIALLLDGLRPSS